MKFIGIIFSIFIIAINQSGMPKNIEKKMNKAISETYDLAEPSIEPILLEDHITKTLPSLFTDSNFFKVDKGNMKYGYAYLGEASSKTDTFIYLVMLDNDLQILGTEILVYREDYGGEIGSSRWLKQFKGKTLDDSLIYGDNVMAISGATISVKSMTNAMNNLLKSLQILNSIHVL